MLYVPTIFFRKIGEVVTINKRKEKKKIRKMCKKILIILKLNFELVHGTYSSYINTWIFLKQQKENIYNFNSFANNGLEVHVHRVWLSLELSKGLVRPWPGKPRHIQGLKWANRLRPDPISKDLHGPIGRSDKRSYFLF
jgi:hypothetical protein